MKDFLIMIVGLVVTAAIVLTAQACTKAKSATPASIELHTAPDGTKCYVLAQGEELKGISCR